MNLKLIQNSTNTVCLTLSESISYTATPVYFLFRFVNDSTNEQVLFTCSDISSNPSRYNKFNVSLTGASYTNLSAGTISLSSGNYLFEVYEQLNPINLFLSGTSGVVLETFNAVVTGSSLNAITDSYTGMSQTYDYYEPY